MRPTFVVVQTALFGVARRTLNNAVVLDRNRVNTPTRHTSFQRREDQPMRKLLAISTLTFAAALLCGLPAAANAATVPTTQRPADPVWSLFETEITLDQCNSDGQFLEASGYTTDYTCDAGDNGAEDGYYALWIIVDE